MNLLPFDLQKALSGAKVVTRGGVPVTDVHHFPTSTATESLRAVIGGLVQGFLPNGRYYGQYDSAKDLFLLAEPKLRAWKDQSEVPLNAWFRRKEREGGSGAIYALTTAHGSGVNLGHALYTTYPVLLSDWEYTLDSKTFLPCGISE